MRAGRLEGGAAPRPVGPRPDRACLAPAREVGTGPVGPTRGAGLRATNVVAGLSPAALAARPRPPDGGTTARSASRAAPRTSLRHAETPLKRTRCRPRPGSFLRINRTSGAGRAAHRGVSGWPSCCPRGSRCRRVSSCGPKCVGRPVPGGGGDQPRQPSGARGTVPAARSRTPGMLSRAPRSVRHRFTQSAGRRSIIVSIADRRARGGEPWEYSTA